jgi:hypothetical protein
MAVTVKRLFYRGTGTSASVAPRYSSSFNNAGAWTLDGSSYTITILESVHDKGTSPTVTAYEDDTITFQEVDVSISVNAIGDVTMSVTSSPDNRFSGKIVII